MKLYVIGNGFDLHHRIPSSYGHFAAYAQHNHREVTKAVEQYLPSVGENWCNLEASLAELDYDGVIQDCACFLTPYGADDFRASAYHDFEYEIDQIARKLSSSLRQAFSAWIHGVAIPGPSAACLPLDPTGLYLTFNYTDTLARVYGVPKNQIWHIHGKVPSEPHELVLGHAWAEAHRRPTYESHSPEGDDFREVQGYQRLDAFFRDTFKPSGQIIRDSSDRFVQLKGVSEVIILGHSLSPVDMCYFEEIAKHVQINQVRWTATYYWEHERNERANVLATLGVPEALTCITTLNAMGQYQSDTPGGAI
ncbi:hypothetical protein AEMCBJ_31760 (plasmid) [Cupriavidus necator]|uniref:bacteriophage abortive infection AbiH family protein n=1 Tax=Cupriavidus necator TaxID=106590 RepID=UPI003F73E014